MSVAGMLLRFTVMYIALMVIVASAGSLLNAKPGMAINIGILLGAAGCACFQFAQSNKRYLTPAEKKMTIIGMLLIDMVLQAVFGGAALQATGVWLPLGLVGLVMVVIAVLHGLGLYFVVGITGKHYERQSRHLHVK